MHRRQIIVVSYFSEQRLVFFLVEKVTSVRHVGYGKRLLAQDCSRALDFTDRFACKLLEWMEPKCAIIKDTVKMRFTYELIESVRYNHLTT